MTTITPNATSSDAISISTDAASAKALQQPGESIVTVTWRNPARTAAINLPAAVAIAMNDKLSAVPEEFRSIISDSLTGAAKSILKSYCEAYSTIPSDIPASLLTLEEIIDGATTASGGWMPAEELQRAWEQSATRKQWVVDRADLYRSNREFRRQVNDYAEQLLKLAGKRSQYTEQQLDKLLAKLAEPDLDTELGEFVVRRVKGLKLALARKPAEIAADLL